MSRPCFLLALSAMAAASLASAAEKPRPLMRDFIGVCVHTVQFKPALYAPVAHLVRDYHPMQWDVGGETDHPTEFPLARNKVDWQELYGAWEKAGYRIDADLMFDNIDPEAWRDPSHDAYAYGNAFARYFGPSGKALVECLEIGNEPGKYDDAVYRQIFEGMARGAREGDRRLRIATCAVNLGKSGRYSKSVDCLAGLSELYDVVNIHIYAEVEGWPTWRRSFPEDPRINFLRDLGHVLTWRNENAPEKEVWLTEFGWDASTKPPPTTGDFVKWEGSTELQQAEWIVRGFLVLSATAVDRAYLFFFNDEDEPHVHGSSGLTRNFQPKPSYYALSHLQATLGSYRFARAIRDDPSDCFVYEYQSGDSPDHRIWVVWKPQGPEKEITLAVPGSGIGKAERMPLQAGPAESVQWTEGPPGSIKLQAGEAPIYLWLK